MKTLEEIKNEESKKIKYRDFDNLIDYGCRSEIILVMSRSAKLYAKEVAIASLEKASENAKIKYTLDEELNKHYLIDKSSIINENNIIK